MSIIRSVLAAALIGLVAPLALAAPQPGQDEASLDTLLETIRANRRALVEVNLGLSEAEAAQFWPLYDRYQGEMNALADRLVKVIKDYEANFATLTDAKALELIKEYLAIEADRTKVRQNYLGEFAKILPGRTVARFYQIENKMDAVIRYDLASTIPVVDTERPPAK